MEQFRQEAYASITKYDKIGDFRYFAQTAFLVLSILQSNAVDPEFGYGRMRSGIITKIPASPDVIGESIQRTTETVRAILPLGPKGVFLANLFADLGVSSEIILNIIQRESKWNSNSESSKGAIGLMQIRPIGLDDMLLQPKKYKKYILKISNKTLNALQDEKLKADLILLQSILGNSHNPDFIEYNRIITKFRNSLYNPELNVIIGTIFFRLLEDSVTPEYSAQYQGILDNLTEKDIAIINKIRVADGRKPLDGDYDFSDLDIRKVLVLAWYNVGKNAQDIGPGIRYAIAILT